MRNREKRLKGSHFTVDNNQILRALAAPQILTVIENSLCEPSVTMWPSTLDLEVFYRAEASPILGETPPWSPFVVIAPQF